MLGGRVDAAGRLYVNQGAPGADAVIRGGLLRAPDGAIFVSAIAPSYFVNGFGVTALGRLCYSPGAVINNWQQGYPFFSDGSLITVALNATPLATDPFVGGVRVHNLFGVYLTDVAPVGLGFSDGFSEGFS